MFVPSEGSYIPDDQRYAGAEFNPYKLHRVLFTLLQKEGEAAGLSTEGNLLANKTSFFVKSHQKNFGAIKEAIELTEKLKSFTSTLSKSNEGSRDDTIAKELPQLILALSPKLYDLRLKFKDIDLHYCAILRYNPLEEMKTNVNEETLPGLGDESAIELKPISPTSR